ncbi:MAG: hypothetical protein KKF44_09235 [Nanoarchaeota archaeon]|nr:hypothetical protein [Nanoarchaeota archaeon]
MGFVDVIKAAAKEAIKPEGYIKGDKFEDFILSLFSSSDLWVLIKRTQDYDHNSQMYEKKSLDPDFRFKHKVSNRQINIECKYRSCLNKGMLEWCKPGQLQRYKEFDKYNNTYIIIGLGGEPTGPDNLFLIKLSDVKFEKLYPSYLKNFEVKRNCCFDMKNGKIMQLDVGVSKTLLLKQKLEFINKLFR